MVHLMASIQENITQIKQEILKRSPVPESVRILGVTKFQPVEKVVEALRNGIQVLGVNYAQDGAALNRASEVFVRVAFYWAHPIEKNQVFIRL
ncbi:hypothetical protein EBQ90_01010 [bacterium]|nr:hypothetical protein [bacterium]